MYSCVLAQRVVTEDEEASLYDGSRFSCPLCERTFFRKFNWVFHLDRQHDVEVGKFAMYVLKWPFKTPLYHGRIKNKAELAKYILMCHSTARLFVCYGWHTCTFMPSLQKFSLLILLVFVLLKASIDLHYISFCAAQPDDEVVSTQFGMDFMNHPFKPILPVL